MNIDLPRLVTPATLIGLCVALGIGLLIGAERERHKYSSSDKSGAGIRTFAVTALLGAIGYLLGDIALLAIAVIFVGIGAMVAYQRTQNEHPGITTEFALVLTCILGGLAIRDALLAAGVGAVLALLLSARTRIHYFVSQVLSEQELHDIILFFATALIILPITPDRYMGPFDAINPNGLARLIVIVMAISASGYVAVRVLGSRYGLSLAGFASGFVSSTVTIHSMGQRVKDNPAILSRAVAGAVLSSVATIIQMSLIIFLVQPALLRAMAIPMALGGAAAVLYAILILFRTSRQPGKEADSEAGRAFDLKTSISFSALLATVMVASAGLNATFGSSGMLIAAAIAGFADAHATAASAASLLAAGKIEVGQAIVPILLGLTTNTITKAAVALKSGGKAYALQIIPGLVLMIAAVWIGAWLAQYDLL